jgi:hypothetical protein
MAPASVMMMAMAEAKIGRSMKKPIIGRSLGHAGSGNRPGEDQSLLRASTRVAPPARLPPGP